MLELYGYLHDAPHGFGGEAVPAGATYRDRKLILLEDLQPWSHIVTSGYSIDTPD